MLVFILIRLPTYLFFTTFTLLVLWWIELCYWVEELSGALNRLKKVFIGVNAVLYTFFLVMVIAYAAKNDSNLVRTDLCRSTFHKGSALPSLTNANSYLISSTGRYISGY